MKYTTALFIDKANKIHNFKFNYHKTIYNNSKEKVVITCPMHGDFLQLPASHLRGMGCLLCYTDNSRYNTNSFISKANAVHNFRYTYTKCSYINSKSKVIITCKVHGDFNQTPTQHLRGSGCPACATASLYYHKDEFISKAKAVHNNKYSYEHTNYNKASDKVVITCKFHGEFYQQAVAHLAGRGCPTCKSSKGEIKIRKYLEEHDINFVTEKTFKDCINPSTGKLLRYDFYLPKLNLLIEYDGYQHHNPTSFSSDKSEKTRISNFEAIKARDELKDEYARKSGIQILRISYRDADITSILTEWVSRPTL